MAKVQDAGEVFGKLISEGIQKAINENRQEPPNVEVNAEFAFDKEHIDSISQAIADAANNADMAEQFRDIAESIKSIDFSQDFSGIEKALSEQGVDLTAVSSALSSIADAIINMPDVSNSLTMAVEAIDRNTAAIELLEQAYRSDRQVDYDGDGRVIKVSVMR